MARQATPDLLAEAVDATPRDEVELVFGAPGASRAALQDVPVGLIDDNPFQPRTDYTGIEELAADIAANGLLQVPKGRLTLLGRVQLQYGHRRLRAVMQLGWKTMPVEVQTLIDDHDMAVRAWSENHNRQDFTAIDQARYFRKLIDAGWTQKAIAERLGLAAPTVSNTLRLLELPDDLQVKVAEKQLSARQGEALVSLMTLPQAILKKGDAHYSDDTRPSSIVRAALNGVSSDVIRQRTTDLIRLSTTAVHEEPWYDLELSDNTGDIVSPTCKSCASTIKRDSGVFCTGPATCLKARANQWARGELELAATELGIPAHGMKPPYGAYQAMDDYDTRDLFKELRAQGGCPHGNLRLMYEKSRYRPGPLDRFPEAFPICLHGEGHKCRCLMVRQREQAKAGTANKTTESIGKKLVAEAAAVLAEALTTVPDGILRHVWAPMVDYTLEEKQAKDLSRDEFAMQMAVQILRRKVDNYNSIQTNKDRIEKILQGAGLVSPWTLAGQMAPKSNVPASAVELDDSEIDDDADDDSPAPSATEEDDDDRPYYAAKNRHIQFGSLSSNNGYIEPTVDREAPDYIDAKLRRIAGWIDEFQDAGDGLPTPESVVGNFVNLEKLLETIVAQESEADQLKLKQMYDSIYTHLAALSDRVELSYRDQSAI